MPLRYLLDEDLRGPLWNAVLRHNATGEDTIDMLRVGDAGAPALHTQDPDLLLWTEAHDRILVTFDKSTMATHLEAHLAAGHSSPGVFEVRPGVSIPLIVAHLLYAAHASDAEEWRNACWFIP